MKDLIRRQDVIEEIKQFSTDNIRLRNGLMELANHMELIPSAQAVEVVYCKDCEYFKEIDQFFGECMHLPNSSPDGLVNDLFWYCADGERKEE